MRGLDTLKSSEGVQIYNSLFIVHVGQAKLPEQFKF